MVFQATLEILSHGKTLPERKAFKARFTLGFWRGVVDIVSPPAMG